MAKASIPTNCASLVNNNRHQGECQLAPGLWDPGPPSLLCRSPCDSERYWHFPSVYLCLSTKTTRWHSFHSVISGVGYNMTPTSPVGRNVAVYPHPPNKVLIQILKSQDSDPEEPVPTQTLPYLKALVSPPSAGHERTCSRHRWCSSQWCGITYRESHVHD